MAGYDLKLLQKQMKEELSDDRYEHTIGVMYTAESLAMRYGVDMTKAAVAGLLHDCAKCIPNAQKIKMCKKHGIEIPCRENTHIGIKCSICILHRNCKMEQNGNG